MGSNPVERARGKGAGAAKRPGLENLGGRKAHASSNLALSAFARRSELRRTQSASKSRRRDSFGFSNKTMDVHALTKRIKKISDIYAKRFGINRDDNWYVLKLQEEMGELIQSYLMLVGQARQKNKDQTEIRNNFEHEIADVLCHILLLANHYKIDLDKVVQDKWLEWEK